MPLTSPSVPIQTTSLSTPTAAELVGIARNLFGESQAEFGLRYGKSQSLISKYERGEIDPPSEMVIQLMTVISAATQADLLTPVELAKQVAQLPDVPATLPLRRAIGDMLKLGHNLS